MVPQLALPEGGEWSVILVIVMLLFGARGPRSVHPSVRPSPEFS